MPPAQRVFQGELPAGLDHRLTDRAQVLGFIGDVVRPTSGGEGHVRLVVLEVHRLDLDGATTTPDVDLDAVLCDLSEPITQQDADPAGRDARRPDLTVHHQSVKGLIRDSLVVVPGEVEPAPHRSQSSEGDGFLHRVDAEERERIGGKDRADLVPRQVDGEEVDPARVVGEPLVPEPVHTSAMKSRSLSIA